MGNACVGCDAMGNACVGCGMACVGCCAADVVCGMACVGCAAEGAVPGAAKSSRSHSGGMACVSPSDAGLAEVAAVFNTGFELVGNACVASLFCD